MQSADIDESQAADAPAAPRVESGDAIIGLRDVHKSFGSLTVLDGVSLDFQRGKTTVIIGPSGTGKSVLLKHIVGLLAPDQGTVLFEGRAIDKLTPNELVEVRKQFGFLFQMSAMFDSMSVHDNICFPLVEHKRMTPRQRDEQCEKVLRMVGLPGAGEKMPADLSGGMRKRAALARAIVLEPKVVLYDEPTTGLDPITSDLINELMITLARRLGITSIVVTHDMHSANKIADRIVMLSGGKVIADAPPQAFAKIDSDIVQRFIHGRADQTDLERIRRGFE